MRSVYKAKSIVWATLGRGLIVHAPVGMIRDSHSATKRLTAIPQIVHKKTIQPMVGNMRTIGATPKDGEHDLRCLSAERGVA